MDFTHEHEDKEDLLYSGMEQVDNVEDLVKRKRIRRLLEARLEQRSLKRELEDYEGELEDKFDWSNF